MSEVEIQKPAQDAPKTVLKSAIQFFFGTILSRFSGFFREVALGAWFGATPVLASFFVAYRFSQLLRRLFGESSLLSSFSPYYEQLRLQSPEKANQFFRDLFASMSTVLGGIIILLEAALFSWWKWGGAESGTQEILFLTMVMLPGVLFVCLYALFSALLQTDRKYFLPSVAPIFFNLIFLAVLWAVKDWDSNSAVVALSVGVTAAFFVQWLSLLISTGSVLKSIRWSEIKLWTPELKKMVSAMSLTIIGIGAVQINSFVDTLFARSADLSGPAYLYYAIRLYQLPLALFGIAMSSALLPPLARARQVGDNEKFMSLLQFALRRSLSLMIPMTIGILVFGESIVNVVYGRGAFDLLATVETTRCLWGYVIGLVPAGAVLLLAPAFYAQKDFKTPLKASLIAVLLNFLLNIFFIYGFEWGSASVAVATSISAFANAGYLLYALTKKEGSALDPKTILITWKVTLCAGLSGLVTMAIGYFLIGGTAASFIFDTVIFQFTRNLFSQVLHLLIYGGMFTLLFFSYAWMFKIDEVFHIVGLKQRESK
jgi:putative peptidoglycan lipid II flippase